MGHCKALVACLVLIALGFNVKAEGDLLIEAALEKELYKSYQWEILLHYKGSESSIHSRDFFLSPAGHYDLKAELVANLQGFISTTYYPPGQHPICRFPARFAWIKNQLELPPEKFPVAVCPGLDEFNLRAPADEVALVYVSENVSTPASVMGHSLLKLSGTDVNGERREHAFSYFTLFDTLNPFSIGYRAFVSGMPGRYALASYKQVSETYLRDEGRNIWEYPLSLQSSTVEILRLHLWELKTQESAYLYTSYNCATVLYQFLRFEKAEIKDTGKSWVAPIDLVHLADDSGLIKSAKLKAAPQWRIRLLQNLLHGNPKRKVINNWVRRGDIAAMKTGLEGHVDRAIAADMLSSYWQYLSNDDQISRQQYASLQARLQQSGLDAGNVDFQLDRYKSPIDSPPLSRISVGGGDRWLLEWQPASSKLEDDHRSYFSEYRTSILDVKFGYDPSESELKLERLDLYAVTSILASDGLTPSLSGKFRFGARRGFNQVLEPELYSGVEGALGYASAFHNDDVLAYVFIGGELVYGDGDGKVLGYPEVGMIIKELFDMKSTISYKRAWELDELKTTEPVDTGSFKQSWYMSNRNSLVLELEYAKVPGVDNKDWLLHYVHRY